MELEKKLGKILKKKKKTLFVAESCTGGLVSHHITNIPDSSDYFIGGVVAYSNKVKVALLGVPSMVVRKNGAVSREVAQAMAKGARKLFNTDFAAAITGIAGPSGGSRKKPVGLAFIAFASKKKTKTKKNNFSRQPCVSKREIRPSNFKTYPG